MTKTAIEKATLTMTILTNKAKEVMMKELSSVCRNQTTKDLQFP